jgi:hypothetical protein
MVCVVDGGPAVLVSRGQHSILTSGLRTHNAEHDEHEPGADFDDRTNSACVCPASPLSQNPHRPGKKNDIHPYVTRHQPSSTFTRMRETNRRATALVRCP